MELVFIISETLPATLGIDVMSNETAHCVYTSNLLLDL